MHHLSTCVVLAAVLLHGHCTSAEESSSFISDAADDPTVVWKRDWVPKGWRMTDEAHKDQLVKFSVLLHHEHSAVEALKERFESVTNPSSKLYGQWMSREEVIGKLSRPHVVDRVRRWLESVGARTDVSGGDVVHVVAKASTAENILHTSIRCFQHKRSGLKVLRHWGLLHLPGSMRSFVHAIRGLSDFPLLQNQGRDSLTAALPPRDPYTWKNDGVPVNAPETWKHVYGIDDHHFGGGEGVTQSVVEFPFNGPSTGYLDSDLRQYREATALPDEPTGVRRGVVNKLGNVQSTPSDSEASLDIQIMQSVSGNADTTFWVVDGWVYEWAQELFSMKTPPLVNSLSFGGEEASSCEVASPNAEHCETLGMQNVSQYLERCDIEFMKVGLRGISLLASSQDHGAPGFANVDCSADAQTAGNATASGVLALNPVYPASSPYITAVGATALDKPQKLSQPQSKLCNAMHCASGGVEVPAMGAVNSDFTSGGGFSIYEKQPAYQKEAVADFLASGALRPPATMFNSNNRAYPDISVLGDRIFMVRNNQSMLSGGTSASTPIFAGMVSLLNAARAKVGKGPLGFLNPVLYQAAKISPEIFNDVTSGNNSCTVSLFAPHCCHFGYGAGKGWDPVTGLGTPKFAGLLKYVLALP